MMKLPNGLRYRLVGGMRLAVETDRCSRSEPAQNAARTHLSTSIIQKDLADRPSTDPSETVVQQGSPCPVCSSPNSWWVLKTEY